MFVSIVEMLSSEPDITANSWFPEVAL